MIKRIYLTYIVPISLVHGYTRGIILHKNAKDEKEKDLSLQIKTGLVAYKTISNPVFFGWNMIKDYYYISSGNHKKENKGCIYSHLLK
jgi:hypothetical protein